MLKKIKHIMFIVIGSTIGTCIGNALFVWVDYRNNPSLYEMYSSPWYTRIISVSVICGIILLVEIAVQCFVLYKIKKSKI